MRLPASTYRLQMHAGFTLDDARAIIPYLHDLGIGDVYLSPVTRSRLGSAHGYDQCDPTAIDPELGGREAFDRFVDALREHDMGLLLDIVPNHMAASAENPWWWDVLKRGRDSRYAPFFDIDWDAAAGKVVLPVLGSHYAAALRDGELEIRDGEVRYHDQRFPLSDDTAAAARHPLDAEGLDRLLRSQHYRLSFWRSGSRELNYRRFFDITDLVCLRQEDPDVFEVTHRLALELVDEGSVTGLRVDHVDGLRDPAGYLLRLSQAAPYVVVEKILDRREELPDGWPVAGTVGYEWLNAAGGIFVDPDGAAALRDAAVKDSFADVVASNKRLVLRTLFAGEIERLAGRIRAISRDTPQGWDMSAEDVREALIEISAHLDVYRTYLDGNAVTASDRRRLDRAFAAARDSLPGHRHAAVDLIEDWTRAPDGERLDVLMSWQQITGPAMAKGFEDTTLYVWPPLQSRNEVGGDPGKPAVDPDELHRLNERRLQRWPGSLNATSTHDTKRSEDVRARLDVLSEIPREWNRLVARWTKSHAGLRAGGVPDRSEQLYVYQSIVGAWPSEMKGFAARIKRYMRKAAREAKVNTSWLDPDETHERALDRFVDGVLRDDAFRADVTKLLSRIEAAAVTNSLAQVVLKVASPGVPDVYQGAEVWHRRLVDPDNREPVPFDRLRRMAKGIDDEDPARLLHDHADGRLKLFVTRKALRFRREHHGVFGSGEYEPLRASGAQRRHCFAFARRTEDAFVVAAVPRLTATLSGRRFPLGDVWGDTALKLPPGAPKSFTDVLTGRAIRTDRTALRLAEAFATLPVCMLTTS